MLPLVGCSSLSGTGDKGYISGEGQVVLIDAADRDDPVDVSGRTLQDEPLSLAELRGRPVVVNLWGSWCGPCRKEAPDLVAAHEQLAGAAEIVGINIRDTSPAQGQRFEERFAVPYPSLFDPDGTAALAFAGYVRQGSIPSTLILDAEGRVAATFSGPIPSVRTLVDAVEEVAGDG